MAGEDKNWVWDAKKAVRYSITSTTFWSWGSTMTTRLWVT